MMKINVQPLLVLGFMLCLAPFGSGCTVPLNPIQAQAPAERKGYGIELATVREGSLDTASYLPSKIRFELNKGLEQRGLLNPVSQAGRRLAVHIVVVASYAPFTEGEGYRHLESRVQVMEPETGKIVAETTVWSAGGFRFITSDFEELSHAKRIADFLEALVR